MNILAVCDSEKDIEAVRTKKNVRNSELLIYTKNMHLYNKLIKNGKKIFFLETDEKMYDVADDVWDLIDTVNQFVRKYIKDFEAHMYELSYHIEGGKNQRILEIVLNIRYLRKLVKENNISSVYLTDCANYELEAVALKLFAKNENLKVENINHDTDSRGLILNGLQWKRELLFYLKIWYGMIGGLKIALKESAFTSSRKKDIETFRIGVIKFSACEKVLNWSKPLLKEIERRKWTYEIVCLKKKDADLWKKWGYRADYLERYTNFGGLCKSLSRFYKNVILLRRNRKELIINYYDCDLSTFCFNTLLESWVDCTVNDVRYNDCAKEYFGRKRFGAIIMNGDTNFVVNRFCYLANKELNQYPIFTQMPLDLSPLKQVLYEPYGGMQKVLFGKSLQQYSFQKAQHISKKKETEYNISSTIFLKGMERRKMNSRGIQVGEISVLWAPTSIVKGLTSYKDLGQSNYAVLDALSNEDCKLFVKFHPNQEDEEVNCIMAPYKKEHKITLIDKSANIYEVFDRVHVVVAQPSTIMFEAASIGIPVICIAPNSMFDCVEMYKDGLWIYDGNDKAIKQIVKLIRDKKYFDQWNKETIQRQDTFFSQFIYEERGIPFMLDRLQDNMS